jgi:hypothetical protein
MRVSNEGAEALQQRLAAPVLRPGASCSVVCDTRGVCVCVSCELS